MNQEDRKQWKGVESESNSRPLPDEQPFGPIVADEDQWVRLVEIVNEDPFSRFLGADSAPSVPDSAPSVPDSALCDVSASRVEVDPLENMLRPSNDRFAASAETGQRTASSSAADSQAIQGEADSQPALSVARKITPDPESGHKIRKVREQVNLRSQIQFRGGSNSLHQRQFVSPDLSHSPVHQTFSLEDSLFSDLGWEGNPSYVTGGKKGSSVGVTSVQSYKKGFPVQKKFVFCAVGLVLFLSLAGIFGVYFLGNSGGILKEGEPIIVKAELDPVKEAPSDPGGIRIPNQDKLVYDRVSGKETEVEEQLVVREEAVIPLSEAVVDQGKDQESGAFILELDAVDEDLPQKQGGLAKPQGENFRELAQVEKGTKEEAKGVEGESPSALEQQRSVRNGMPLPRKVRTVTIPTGTKVGSSGEEISASSSRSSERRVASGEPLRRGSEESSDRVARGSLSGSGFVVQIAAGKTEQGILETYERMQALYPLLASRDFQIQKADLGAKGVYYRLRVGPVSSRADAQAFCSALRRSGLQDCLVRPF